MHQQKMHTFKNVQLFCHPNPRSKNNVSANNYIYSITNEFMF